MNTILRIVGLLLALLCAIGCDSGTTTGPGIDVTHSIVATTAAMDYSEGNMAVLDIAGARADSNLLAIHSDNVVRTYDGAIYVLERLGADNVIKITGSNVSPSTVDYQTSIGNTVNIQDIAFVSPSKAFITQHGANNIVVFDPATGQLTGDTVDLSSYVAYAGSDSAGEEPHMSSAVVHNGKVYVACQRLKAPPGGWLSPADTSKIVIVDATTNLVEGDINLLHRNPTSVSFFGARLYVTSTGAYGANDGGIEVIDLNSDTSEGILVTEQSLGGDVSSVIVISSTKGYAAVSTPSWTNDLVAFDPTTGAVAGTVAAVDNVAIGGMAYDGTYLYVGDRSTSAPGIVVIDPSDNSQAGTTYGTGLPPSSLALLVTGS